MCSSGNIGAVYVPGVVGGYQAVDEQVPTSRDVGLATGCPWPSLAGPGLSLDVPVLARLRLSSHRIVPDSSRVSSPCVSRFMNGAAPRSHFYGTPARKVPNLFCFAQYLRGLDSLWIFSR